MTTVLSLERNSRYQTREDVLHVPFIVRGEVIEDYAIEIQSRDRGSGRVSFLTPDLRPHLRSLVNVDPLDLKELADIPCHEIMDILHQVGRAFQPGTKEHHLFNPDTIHKLQHACRTNNYEAYQEYAGLVNDQSKQLGTLRGLLQFKYAAEPIPLEEVESVESICRRFKTG